MAYRPGTSFNPNETTYPIGVWLKNQRAAARRAHNAETPEQQTDRPRASSVSAERWQELDDIDPSWCPSWPVAWQRCFHLARTHLSGDRPLPEESGLLLIQGEDIGHWTQAQRAEWNTLVPAQQWLLAEVLGLEPLEERVPVSARTTATPRRSRAEMWAANLTAACQYAHREGHLNVPRPHIETVDGTDHALGIFIANSKARKDRLAPERVEELTTIGMRWS